MNMKSKEIAAICGVSRGTVDRALNNRPGINLKTKEKILRVASELGYRPHFVAQSLVKGKTMSLGLVIFDIDNRILAQIINAIETRARELGYFVYLTLTHKDAQTEIDCIHHLIDRRVDGIILMTVNKGRLFEKILKGLNIPVVSIANRISASFPNIWIDDRQAIRDAVSYIVSRGYEEIIYVSPPLAAASRKEVNLFSPLERYAGLKEAFKQAPLIKSTVVKQKSYIDVIDSLINQGNLKQAILCTSDIYAIDIMNHLKKRNIPFPGRIGVMGFDNIDILEYISPKLTTIDYSAREIGFRVVDTLVDRINGLETPHNLTFPHRIMEGDSL